MFISCRAPRGSVRGLAGRGPSPAASGFPLGGPTGISEKNTPPEKKTCIKVSFQNSEHQIRGWRAVSAAGFQGKGSPKRSDFFTDAGMRSFRNFVGLGLGTPASSDKKNESPDSSISICVCVSLSLSLPLSLSLSLSPSIYVYVYIYIYVSIYIYICYMYIYIYIERERYTHI